MTLELDVEERRISSFGVENDAGETLMSVVYKRYAAERPVYVVLEIPRVHLRLTIDLKGWESFTPSPNTFVLSSNAAFKNLEMEKVWPQMLKRLLMESDP